jgi:hypothetical protein
MASAGPYVIGSLQRISPWGGLGLVLIPFAIAGYFFDDMHNSALRGAGIALGMSLGDFLAEQLQQWVVQQGRLFPVGIVLGTSAWWIADNLLAAQALRITFTLLNVFVFSALIRLLSRDLRLPAVVVMSLSLVIQFNPRWDGLSSFMPLNQTVLLFVLGAWYAVVLAFTTLSKRVRLGAASLSLVSAACALLTYEIGVASVMGAFLIIWTLRERDRHLALRLGIAMLLVAITFVVAYTMVRLGVQSRYDGIQAGPLSHAPFTLLAQLGSAFPLAFLNNTVLGVVRIKVGLWLVLFPLFLACWAMLLIAPQADKQKCVAINPDREGIRLLLILGSLLVILPALVISFSEKYQRIIQYGDAYIVVYMQYFGAALLLGSLIEYLALGKTKRGVLWLLCVVLASVSAMTVAVNMNRVKLKNEAFKGPRNQMERLIRTGFMKKVTPETLLIVDSVYPWEAEGAPPKGLCTYFFSHHLERPVRCLGLQSLIDSSDNGPPFKGANAMLLRRSRDGEGRDTFTLQGGGQSQVATARGGQFEFTQSSDVRPLVFHWPGKGFYDWEPPGRRDFIWARSPAQIRFWNPQEVPVNVTVKLKIQSAVQQQITGVLGGQSLFSRPAFSGEDQNFEFEVLLGSGLTVLLVEGNGVPATAKGDPRAFSFRLLGIQVAPSP